MRKYLDNHPQLGPWKEDKHMPPQNLIIFSSRDHPCSQNSNASQAKNTTPQQANSTKNKQFILPRMSINKYDKTRTQNKIKTKSNFKIKVQPLKLQIHEDRSLYQQMQQARKSKTLSFQPPLISFYNKNHPRVIKNRYIKFPIDESQLCRSHRISKVDLMQHQEYKGGEHERQQKQKWPRVNGINVSADKISESVIKNRNKSKNRQSVEYQFAKKRSLMQVLRYLKNCQTKRATHLSLDREKIVSKIQRYQNAEDGKTSKFQCYVPASNRSLANRKT